MKIRFGSGLIAVAVLAALAASQRVQAEQNCSVARDEIQRDACYKANAEEARNNSTSRQRVEESISRGQNAGAGSAAPSTTFIEKLDAAEAERERMRALSRAAQAAPPTAAERTFVSDRVVQNAQAKRFIPKVTQDLRFTTPMHVRWDGQGAMSAGYATLPDIKKRIPALFPDTGKDILKWLQASGDKKMQRFIPCYLGASNGELLGVLMTYFGNRRDALYRFNCQGQPVHVVVAIYINSNLDGNPIRFDDEELEAWLSQQP